MRYSFNRDKTDIIFAQAKDINASYKDLGVVCDAIRYKSVLKAISILDSVKEGVPILYKKHNKYMGSRHELHGRKGRYPIKCAALIKKVLVNAQANARNKGFEPDSMFVVHAAANKTLIAPRRPSKGALFTTRAYGYAVARSSNLELAKIEIGISNGTEKGLSSTMQQYIKRNTRELEALQKLESAKKVKPKKPTQIKKEAPKGDLNAKPKEHKADNTQKSTNAKELSQKAIEPKALTDDKKSETKKIEGKEA